jgi:3-methyladenine DNA glycosylase/8-oxoguanine DNA glycosylase
MTETEIGRLPLRGAGGEPVDFARTIHGHGCATLPPMRPSLDPPRLEAVLPAGRGRPRRIALVPRGRAVVVSASGPAPSATAARELLDGAARLLRLDADLSGFYGLAADDPELSWAVTGAGRMARSASPFEDLIKTICTTNCAWSATQRMTAALVEHLGEPAVGGGKAFPTPRAMAAADEDFYRDVVRAGYRGTSLREVARRAAEGELNLDALAPDGGLSEEEAELRLLALPGVGPYAAAHMLMMLGWHSRLILDSWTRPTYARLMGRASVTDAAIQRRFRRYGAWQGLAFWLFLTRDWIPEPGQAKA